MSRLSSADQAALARLIDEELEKPPTLGVIGVSGVGKSSAINAMFNTSLEVSHTVACTKRFEAVPFGLNMRRGPAEGARVELVVCDAPGLGEDVDRDPALLRQYEENLPKCDIILWIMNARNRAIALDQQYLDLLRPFHERIVFGLSQVDLVEPMNWKKGLPIPSREQEMNIREIVEDRSKSLSRTLSRKVDMIPFSSSRGYNLETLFLAMLQSCTGNRSWIFQGLKGFELADFDELTQRASAPRRKPPRQRTEATTAPAESIDDHATDSTPQSFFLRLLDRLFGYLRRPEVADRLTTSAAAGSEEELDELEASVRASRLELLDGMPASQPAFDDTATSRGRR